MDSVFGENRNKRTDQNSQHPVTENLNELYLKIIAEINKLPAQNFQNIFHNLILHEKSLADYNLLLFIYFDIKKNYFVIESRGKIKAGNLIRAPLKTTGREYEGGSPRKPPE